MLQNNPILRVSSPHMLNKKFFTIFILSVFVLIFFISHNYSLIDDPQGSLCTRVFPESVECIKKEEPVLHYLAYTDRKTFLGTVFNTEDTAPKISGYGGLISMAVGLSPEGRIEEIKINRHMETVSYTGDLNIFTRKFIGKTKDSPLILGQDIDTISGATISSKAIIETIRQSINLISGGQKNTGSLPAQLPIIEMIIVFIIAMIALAGLIKQSPSLRWMALFSGLFYLGFAKNTMFSIIHPVNAVLGQFPSLSSAPLLWTLLLVSIGLAFIFGNLYCGSICPFGAIQEIIFGVGRKLKLPILKESETFSERRFLKYSVLLIVLLIALIFLSSSALNIELFIMFFSRKASLTGWIFILLALSSSLITYRLWCRYFCPAGMLIGLLGQFSFYKINCKEPKCKACSSCVNNCPTRAIRRKKDKLTIDQSECIRCGKCLTKCLKENYKLLPFYEK
jgi:ferredoxin